MKAILTGNTITIEKDALNKNVYPIDSIISVYASDGGFKTLSLCDRDTETPIITVSTKPGESNLIFGSNDPDTALTSAQTNLGSGGGGSASSLPSGAATDNTLQLILTELKDDVFVTSVLWEDRANTVAVFYREERVRSQDDGTVTTVYTRLSDNVIVGSLPSGSIPVQGATDRDIRYDKWQAKNAGTGYVVGNWLANTIIFDTDGLGAVVSSTWYNLSTSTPIAVAPLDNDLTNPSDQLSIAIGTRSDTPATTDTGIFSVISLVKRGMENWTTLITEIGSPADVTIPTSNTSTSTLKGLLRFIASILNPATTSLSGSGIVSASDIVCTGRIRSVLFHNNTPTTLYLQIHNKTAPLVTGDIPITGAVYRLPGNASIVYGQDDFGFFGRIFGTLAQQRIAVSSTFGTYTPATMTNTAINIEVI